MNSYKINITQFLFIFASIFFSNKSICQSQLVSFDKTPINQVIENLEKQTEYIFNYDPEQLKGFHFSGKVDLTDFDNELTKILFDSPYSFELNQNTVLIYLPNQETHLICGKIYDAKTGEPLVAANIFASETFKGIQSNAEGYFEFEITADLNQQIEISYLGYENIKFIIKQTKQGDCPTYLMKFDESLINSEVIITDYILDGITEGSNFGAFELNFDQLSKSHSTVEHDILKTTQLLPGINSIDDSATNIQIRGSSPDQNLILWEGVPIYNAGHIFGMISAINPFNVEDVNVYKGAHDPQYDNRVGGVIDISLNDSINNHFHGSIGSTLTEVHTNLEIPIVQNHLSLILAARKSFNGLYNSPPFQSYTQKVFQGSIIKDQEVEVELGILNAEQILNYNDWNAKLLYQASDRLNISLSAYNNRQDFEYKISFPGDPGFRTQIIDVNTKAIESNVDYKINKIWKSSFSFYNSSYNNETINQEVEDGIIELGLSQYNSLNDRSYKLMNVFDPGPNININVGYEYNTKKVYLNLAEISYVKPEFGSETNELAHFHNLFLSTNFNWKKIKLDAGVRATKYVELDELVISPRLNLQYSINDHWKIKADGGIYHQFVSQLNDFGFGQISRDNPLWVLNTSFDALSQKAHKVATGFVYNNNDWLLDIEAYYNHITGVSTISPVLVQLHHDYFDFSKGTVTKKGVDLLLKKRWSKFNAWINYSYGLAVNEFPRVLEKPFWATNDIRHIVSLVASYKVKAFQFSLNAKYHSGLPYSDPRIRFLENVPPEENVIFKYDLTYDDFNDRRLIPYTRVDFNVNFRPRFKSYKNLRSEISISIINLFDYENIVSRNYYIEFAEGALIPDKKFGAKILLGRTPLLLARFYF